jgi:hypothetical protein
MVRDGWAKRVSSKVLKFEIISGVMPSTRSSEHHTLYYPVYTICTPPSDTLMGI